MSLLLYGQRNCTKPPLWTVHAGSSFTLVDLINNATIALDSLKS